MNVVDRGDAGDRCAAGPVPDFAVVVDEGSGVLGIKGAADQQRNAVAPRRRHGRRIDHLGAEVREFEHLLVAQSRDRQGILHAPGVGRHDARNVGPDLDPLGVERGADERGGEVGAAASQGRRLTVRTASQETGHHLQRGSGPEVREVGGDRLQGPLQIDDCGLERAVRRHQGTRVTSLGWQALSAQGGGEEPGREKLAVADDPVDQGLGRAARRVRAGLAVAHRRLQAVAEGFDRGRQGRPIVVRRYLGPDFQMMNAQRH